MCNVLAENGMQATKGIMADTRERFKELEAQSGFSW